MMATALSLAALFLASLACVAARGVRRHTRRLHATLEEMVSLIELLTERYPAAAVLADTVVVSGDTGSSDYAMQHGLTEQGKAVRDAGPAQAMQQAQGADLDLRKRVLRLDSAGASRSAICRETGLSQGEVRLLLAMWHKMGGVAG